MTPIKYARPSSKLLANVVLVLCLTGCESSITFPAPFDGRVSFSPDEKYFVCGIRGSYHGGGGIYRMDKDWTNPTRLTTPTPPTCDGHPAYSPDGLKVVFTRHPACNRAEPGHLFIMNADGTNPTQLSSGPYLDTAPVFSPEGERIYFLRSWAKDSRSSFLDVEAIYSVRSDGSDGKKITADYRMLRAPALSPNGKYLIFVPASAYGQSDKLHVLSLETQQEIRVIEPSFQDLSWKKFEVVIEDPVYLRDGGSILFGASIWPLDEKGTRTSGAANAIYRCNLETSVTERVADVAPYGERWPAVSPDGETIVFLENSSSLGGILKSFWSIKSDGSNPLKIGLHLEQREASR